MRDAKAKTRARGIRKESDVGSTRTRRVPVERLSRHESGNRAESVVGRSRTGEASVERTKRTGMAVRGDADADAVDGTGEAGGEVSATDAAPWQSVQLWGGMRHDSVSARKNAVGARAGPTHIGQCLTTPKHTRRGQDSQYPLPGLSRSSRSRVTSGTQRTSSTGRSSKLKPTSSRGRCWTDAGGTSLCTVMFK